MTDETIEPGFLKFDSTGAGFNNPLNGRIMIMVNSIQHQKINNIFKHQNIETLHNIVVKMRREELKYRRSRIIKVLIVQY